MSSRRSVQPLLQQVAAKGEKLFAELHAKQADTTRLQSYKQRIANFYHEKDMVPEEYKQRVLLFLDTVPDTPRCLHGDLHIGNIITDGQRDLWIDLGEFAYGVPEWDLALLWTMCHNMPGDRVELIFHITHDTMQAHWDIFFPAYLGTNAPQAIHEATQRLLPYYAAKVPYIFHMVFNRPMPDAALQNIGKYL